MRKCHLLDWTWQRSPRRSPKCGCFSLTEIAQGQKRDIQVWKKNGVGIRATVNLSVRFFPGRSGFLPCSFSVTKELAYFLFQPSLVSYVPPAPPYSFSRHRQTLSLNLLSPLPQTTLAAVTSVLFSSLALSLLIRRYVLSTLPYT